MKLNVGSGFDYREAYVNIDGSDKLPRVDRVIDLSTDRLTDHFESNSVDEIVAQDFIEHHFHWQAVALMRCFFELVRSGGTVTIRVPDMGYLTSWRLRVSPEERIMWIFGGQDIPQGKGDEDSRRRFPQFFCHKYGYTQKSMRDELAAIGFIDINIRRQGKNLVAVGRKP